MKIKDIPKKATKRNKIAKNTKKVTNKQKEEHFGYQKPLVYAAYPQSTEAINSFADEVVRWAEQDTSLRYTQFASERRIRYNTFKKIMNKTPYARNAWEIVKQKIVDRRELQALQFKINASIVMQTMPLYDEEFKAYIKWKSALRQEEEKASQTVVLLERFPETDAVPQKPEHEA